MTKKPDDVTRTLIKGIAGGLLLMGFFTLGWSGMAENELNGTDNGIEAITFSLFSIVFIAYGIYLLKISKRFPEITNDDKKLESKKLKKLFYITWGTEGFLIGITCCILSHFHYVNFIIPSIALIVGLHFYPMARIFKRKIDYYFATWTCLIALCGIAMLILKSFKPSQIDAFVCIGAALSTTSYGIFMLYKGSQVTKNGLQN